MVPQTVLILGLGLAVVPSVRAETIPGRWEKVEILAAGSEVVVTTRDGSRLEGRFQEMTDADVVLLIDGRRLGVARITVDEILRVRHREKNRGPLMLGIGAGVRFLVGWNYRGDEVALGFATIPVSVGVGAASGYVVGRFMKSGEATTTSRLYRAR
jgi:hypothetical protein